MDNPPSNLSEETLEIRRLAKAMRFALVAVVLVISYFLVRGAHLIPKFEVIFKDMLGGKPLPALTVMALRGAPVFLVVSYLVPILAIVSLGMRKLAGAYYLLGVLLLVAVIQFIVLFHALSLPLFEIVAQMGGQP